MLACSAFAAALRAVVPVLLVSGRPASASSDDAVPIATSVQEVSIGRGTALVTRRGEVPDGGGHFVVRGLSGETVADSVRLKLDGGEANGVEVREARHATVPEERIATLQRRLVELTHAQRVANDQLALETALRTRLEALLDQEAAAHVREVASGKANERVWTANAAYLDEQLLAARKSERAAQWAANDARAAVEAATAELGELQKGDSVRTFDLVFDVVALRHGTLALEVGYVVGRADWSPRYDLRADRQLAKVELTYRAEISQQTGEDWKDVDLFLSTAEPKRGVVGPEAKTVWLSLAEPEAHGRIERRLKGLGYAALLRDSSEGEVSANTWSAAVENEGLSLRYRLPRKETIESRAGNATVLVGRATLAVNGEHVCTPALDPSVWVRGRTRNTSDFVLLPGPSAVFFGNDFVGQSSVALVRPGQEFTLHLGLDAGLTVERKHVEDQAGSAGLFGTKKQQVDRWRVVVENHGAVAAATDGSVKVLVREVLPKSKDDRIDVTLVECAPPLVKGERFDRDREERGVLTWELDVANGGKSEIDWKSRLVWPDDMELSRVGASVVPIGGGGPPTWFVVAIVVGLASTLVLWRRSRHVRALRVAAVVGLVASGAVASAQQAAVNVDSSIDRVTLFGSGAIVERVATLPDAGTFVIRGLPAAADPATVRVRVHGGDAVGVDVRERHERSLPDARLDALRETVRRLAREETSLQDERAALQATSAQLAKQLAPAAVPPSRSGSSEDGRPTASAWAAERDFLATRLAALQNEQRTNEWALVAKQQELNAARRELQGGEQPSVVLRDVVVDAVATGNGALTCEISYLVGAAGWAPTYELRAAKELAKIQLTYRARVWQATSEDWSNVDLWLSSAQPRRGAAGPDPQPQWLTLRSKDRPASGMATTVAARRAEAVEYAELDKADVVVAAAAPAPLRAPPFATVADEGLSVRFHLPDRQTVASSDQGRVVLIGRTELPLAVERTCVPALDPTVWLRGKATNTSEWTLLPGETAVHLGNDYLGRGTLALTQRGQPFDVHLGPDPFVTVERVELEDQWQTSMLSRKGTQAHSWRLRFENHGAPSTAADGSVTVEVQESLPKARDERITVRLDSARPEPSRAADDQKRFDEKGVLTWRLALPRARPTEIEWRWTARFPESERLVRSVE